MEIADQPHTKRIRREELFATNDAPSSSSPASAAEAVSRSPSPDTLRRLREHYMSLYESVTVSEGVGASNTAAAPLNYASGDPTPLHLTELRASSATSQDEAGESDSEGESDSSGDDGKKSEREKRPEQEREQEHEHEYEFRLFAAPAKGSSSASASKQTSERPGQGATAGAAAEVEGNDLTGRSNDPAVAAKGAATAVAISADALLQPAPPSQSLPPTTAPKSGHARVRIRSDSPAAPLTWFQGLGVGNSKGGGGFLAPAHRPLSYYFTDPAGLSAISNNGRSKQRKGSVSGNESSNSSDYAMEEIQSRERRAQMQAAAVTGETVRAWAQRRQPGYALPWRVKRIVGTTIIASTITTSTPTSTTTTTTNTTTSLTKSKKRAGKKRRLVLRRRAQSERDAEERKRGEALAREAEEREKRTRRNREKKVKRIAREKAKRKSAVRGMDGDGDGGEGGGGDGDRLGNGEGERMAETEG